MSWCKDICQPDVRQILDIQDQDSFSEFLFEEPTHFWKENAGPIESSWSTQVKLVPGHGARLAMFSARFNEKNKEACFAVVARIQAPKLFGTHIQVKWNKNHQKSFRRIVLLTKLQACTAVGSWGHRNEVPCRAQASGGEPLRDLNGGSRCGKDIYCTPQNPQYWTEATNEPSVEFASHVQDWILTFYRIILRFCYFWSTPFYLNKSCGMQSFDSRFEDFRTWIFWDEFK